jgi:hypothetical protein
MGTGKIIVSGGELRHPRRAKAEDAVPIVLPIRPGCPMALGASGMAG